MSSSFTSLELTGTASEHPAVQRGQEAGGRVVVGDDDGDNQGDGDDDGETPASSLKTGLPAACRWLPAARVSRGVSCVLTYGTMVAVARCWACMHHMTSRQRPVTCCTSFGMCWGV